MGKCDTCGMLRAKKDLVLLENEIYICFSCWNREIKKKKNLKDKTETINN
jgi:hypothetical protein